MYEQRKILIFLVVELIILGIIIFITLTFLFGTKARSMLVGIVAVVMNIAMYTSPLTVMVLIHLSFSRSRFTLLYTIYVVIYTDNINYFMYVD